MGKLWGRDRDSGYLPMSKYRYKMTIYGPDKKERWVRLPNTTNMQRYILARKILSMNYILHQPRNNNDYLRLKTRAEWDRRVQENRELPPSLKYIKRTRRRPRGTAGPALVTPSQPPPVLPISAGQELCNLQDVALFSAPELFSDDIAKREMKLSEEWQCRHWRTQIKKDYHSFNLNETISNIRMAALSSKDIKTPPTLHVIFMENIRYAVYTHQWKLVLKGIEGLLAELTTQNKCWILWNGAFLALANIYKNDVTKIVEYSMHVKDFMFCYPRRIGIEVALWLTQKGYFVKGFHLVEEWHDTNRCLGNWDFTVDRENTKRPLIDLIAILMKAVFQYSCWKRDTVAFKEGTYFGDDFALKRCGECAMVLYEQLLQLSMEAECDVTIFIQPLIELKIELESTVEARQLFKEAVQSNFGNAVLEDMYLDFLESYFPIDEEIQLYTKRKERRVITKRMGAYKQDKKVRLFIVRKYKLKETVPLLPKPKPEFAW